MNKRKKVECWNINENPTDVVYENLIKLLCNHSDTFYFITRKELTYDERVITSFAPYMIKTYKTKKWAFTETTGPDATVFVIEVNDATCALLLKHANNLYDWVAPALPEDVTFMKNNFTWFSCTTHEEAAAFLIRSTYYKKRILAVEGLQLERIE